MMNEGCIGENPSIDTQPPHVDHIPIVNDDRRGSKRSRGVLWDDSHTFTLIKCFEDVYVHIKRGNLRLQDWEQVVNSLNKECGLSFSCDQVRNRIDTLKKKHKKESTKQNSTGSTPSTWKFYDACESLWGSSPKCIGIFWCI
ncbi:hypothetical protein KP509_05G071400 [Ceratopteris richardii]|uniref:Myb/SANT-like DNA-binding domain-containing protein n=1 Tax=Ceratopteris richardii TaxID=49495 RepID=A0A8T2US21_CERRI|nr:hypothetical protein KP509_05G071400 [Ceratopteris richardii]